jgi:pimeloyl-ACP methyl ester carboxylesterase
MGLMGGYVIDMVSDLALMVLLDGEISKHLDIMIIRQSRGHSNPTVVKKTYSNRQDVHPATAKTLCIKRSEDAAFAYRTLGPASGVPLLLLTHLRAIIDHWDPLLVNGLASNRPVILVDYPGACHSTGPVPGLASGYADDIADFLALISIKKVDVLGYSLGGFVGQLLALNHPGGVRKLIVAGAGSSAGEGLQGTQNGDVISSIAGGARLSLEGFQALFFKESESSRNAREEWWSRIYEEREYDWREESGMGEYGFCGWWGWCYGPGDAVVEVSGGRDE